MADSKPDLISRLKRKLRQNRFLSPPYWMPLIPPHVGTDALNVYSGNSAVTQKSWTSAQALDAAHQTSSISKSSRPQKSILIGDGHFLPFKDNTFDAVISEAVLEHVHSPDPRCPRDIPCAQAGRIFILFVRRPVSTRLSRLTPRLPAVDGLRYCATLHRLLRDRKRGRVPGPTASLHWIFREYVGLVCSFGSLLLAKAVSLIVGWVTFPLLLLDGLLCLHKNADILASAVYFFGRKP